MKRVLFLLFLLFFPASCKEKTKEIREKPEASQEIRKVHLKDTRFGKTLWTMEAERIEEKHDTTWVYAPKIYFGGEKNRTSTLTADSGLYVPYTGDMVAYGDVYVETEEGAKLWTSELEWRAKEEKIFTEKEVLIKKEGKTIRGKGLTSDPNLKNIVIHGKVEGYE